MTKNEATVLSEKLKKRMFSTMSEDNFSVIIPIGCIELHITKNAEHQEIIDCVEGLLALLKGVSEV